jgi:hypothetical protein
MGMVDCFLRLSWKIQHPGLSQDVEGCVQLALVIEDNPVTTPA